jgi:predicted nucleotidyltransferase component of viral defense system
MTHLRLTAASTRELIHLLILQELADVRRGGGVIVKGGVNLRLFFGSPRYSEDMDLDGNADGSAEIRACIERLFDDRDFTRRLQAFGIRGVDPGQGSNKDTETTYRCKFGVIGGGGVRYPTKVEVSFREHNAVDEVVAATPPQAVLDAYGLQGFEVRHYALDAAVRQKIQALAGRREAQARDVFDLCVLVPGAPAGALLDSLSETVLLDHLEVAHDRALTISYDEYRGQVIEFLEESERASQATEGAWDEMRLRAATLIEAILHRQGRE